MACAVPGRFPEGEFGFAGRTHPLRGNRQHRVDNVRLGPIEDLNDVAVRIGVREFQYIFSGFEERVSNLYRLIHGENGLLIPFVRAGFHGSDTSNKCQHAKHGQRCSRGNE